MKLLTIFSTATLALALTATAGATTVDFTPGLMTSSSGLATSDFNNGLVPAGFTFTGNSGVVSGSAPFVYAQPAGDATDYAYVGAGGYSTATLGAPGVGVNYFGLYWGSPDQYNTLTFTDTMGNTVVYGHGGMMIPGFTPNYQGNPDSYVDFYVTGNNWVSATWTSSTAAFEFDNVTAGLMATPEPASIALLALGLVAVGAGARRRKLSRF
jgi:hypothetical protein